MKYFVVDAFTDQPFGGNPAGVVLLEGKEYPAEGLMLNIAAELRYSETAFVRQDGEDEFTLRYFTPKAEVELCGHATIATFFLLHQKGLVSGQCLCHTNAGDLVIQTGEKVMMQWPRPASRRPWPNRRRFIVPLEWTATVRQCLCRRSMRACPT